MRQNVVAGAVLAFVSIVFLSAAFGDFLYFDDELLILDNPTVHGLTLGNIGKAFSSYDPELYIPLTLISHQIEWSLVGGSPLLYHSTNIVLHLISTLLVFLIFRRIFTLQLTVLCTLLFALHPLQVESVAWVSGRKDLLASMFFLASTYTYLRRKESGAQKYLSMVLFLCGLLSKVSIFPLPLCLLLLDLVLGERFSRKLLMEKLPYVVLSILFLIIAIAGKHVQASNPIAVLLLSPASVLLTLRHIVFPVGLTIFYPFTEHVTMFNGYIFMSAVILTLLIACSLILSPHRKSIQCALAWVLILIAPSLLNMQKGGELGIPDTYLTSDRYSYLAILGPIALFGYLLGRYWSVGILVVTALSFVTFRQIGYWHDSEALFGRVISVGQLSYVAYTNLAGFAAQKGNLEEAEILFERSLVIRRTTTALFNLAQVKAHLEKTDEARALYRELLLLTPNDRQAREKFNALH